MLVDSHVDWQSLPPCSAGAHTLKPHPWPTCIRDDLGTAVTTVWVLPLNKAHSVSELPRPVWTLTSLPCRGWHGLTPKVFA